MKWLSDWKAKRVKRKKARKRAKFLIERRTAMVASATLREIPERFTDDGCSYSPDSLFHNEIGWACRIHDYRYCSRSLGPRDFGPEARAAADLELRKNIALSFPKWLGWVRFLYWKAVRRFGGLGLWNSCGYEVGDRCRHNMKRPLWMEEDHREETGSYAR